MRDFRAATAIVVIGFCAATIFRGWNIVQFSWANALLSSGGHATDHLPSFALVPGLAVAALEASATPVDGPSDQRGANKRIDELTGILSLQPMSSMNWLSLASMRLITGQPPDKVLSALTMSSLTGPNEHAIMYERGIFGLLQWEALPNDFRERTIRDLSGVVLSGNWGDDHRRAVVEALALKSEETRGEIRNLMRAVGIAESELALIRLGSPFDTYGHPR
jgi:hypothetical protein